LPIIFEADLLQAAVLDAKSGRKVHPVLGAVFHPADFPEGTASGARWTRDTFETLVRWVASQQQYVRTRTVNQALQYAP